MLTIAGIIFANNVSAKGFTFTLFGNGTAIIQEYKTTKTDLLKTDSLTVKT